MTEPLPKTRATGQRLTPIEIAQLRDLYLLNEGNCRKVERQSAKVIEGGVHYQTVMNYKKRERWDELLGSISSKIDDKIAESVANNITPIVTDSIKMLFELRNRVYKNIIEKMDNGEIVGGINVLVKLIEVEHLLTNSGNGGDYGEDKIKQSVTNYINIINTDGVEGLDRAIKRDEAEASSVADRLRECQVENESQADNALSN